MRGQLAFGTAIMFGLAFAGPTVAAVLPIIGVYGDAPGCKVHATGNIESDLFVYLTPDRFSSYGSGCEFETLVSSVKGVSTILGVCSAEGEPGTTHDTVIVTGDVSTGYFVKLEGLDDNIGPLTLCPAGPTSENHE